MHCYGTAIYLIFCLNIFFSKFYLNLLVHTSFVFFFILHYLVFSMRVFHLCTKGLRVALFWFFVCTLHVVELMIGRLSYVISWYKHWKTWVSSRGSLKKSALSLFCRQHQCFISSPGRHRGSYTPPPLPFLLPWWKYCWTYSWPSENPQSSSLSCSGSRWDDFSHRASKRSTSSLFSVCCPSLIHTTTAVSWVFLEITGLLLVLEVWGVWSEEEWWEFSPSWGSCASYHLVRNTTIQYHKLRSVCEKASNPGDCIL